MFIEQVCLDRVSIMSFNICMDLVDMFYYYLHSSYSTPSTLNSSTRKSCSTPQHRPNFPPLLFPSSVKEGGVVVSRPPLVRSRTLPAIVVPGVTVLQTALDSVDRRGKVPIPGSLPWQVLSLLLPLLSALYHDNKSHKRALSPLQFLAALLASEVMCCLFLAEGRFCEAFCACRRRVVSSMPYIPFPSLPYPCLL